MPTANFQLLIFDWSGVISDDRLPVYESNMRLMDKHDIKRMAFNEWLPQTTMSPREFFRDHGVEDIEELFEQHKQNWMIFIKRACVRSFIRKQKKFWKNYTEPEKKMLLI